MDKAQLCIPHAHKYGKYDDSNACKVYDTPYVLLFPLIGRGTLFAYHAFDNEDMERRTTLAETCIQDTDAVHCNVIESRHDQSMIHQYLDANDKEVFIRSHRVGHEASWHRSGTEAAVLHASPGTTNRLVLLVRLVSVPTIATDPSI